MDKPASGLFWQRARSEVETTRSVHARWQVGDAGEKGELEGEGEQKEGLGCDMNCLLVAEFAPGAVRLKCAQKCVR